MKLIINRLTMTGLTSDMTTITLTLEWRERPNKRGWVLHMGPAKVGEIQRTSDRWWAYGMAKHPHQSDHMTLEMAKETLEKSLGMWGTVIHG